MPANALPIRVVVRIAGVRTVVAINGAQSGQP
jgi:hypothetical protein